MKLVSSRFLDDGKGFNHGQPATLIQIEGSADYDTLLENILSSGYYDRRYFAEHSGFSEERKVPHFWSLARMIRSLRPRAVLDVGCGRGDVLSLLASRGCRIAGVDFSEAIRAAAWPNVRPHFRAGDLAEVCRGLARDGQRFDTICGFDVWEHLHPARLMESLEAAISTASEDALMLFVVPAFGVDRVFGEQFPLDVEENRARFDAREPFDWLLVERLEPPIPSAGHLICAHTDWWERQFRALGLHRLTEVERRLHAVFDPMFPGSVCAFYLLCRDVEATRPRWEGILPGPPAAWRAWLGAELARDLRSGVITWRGEGIEITKKLIRSFFSERADVVLRRVYRRLRPRRDRNF